MTFFWVFSPIFPPQLPTAVAPPPPRKKRAPAHSVSSRRRPTAGLRLLPQRSSRGSQVAAECSSSGGKGSESESESRRQCPGREVRVWGPGCSSCWPQAWRRCCWPRDVAATRRTRSSCSAAPRSVSGNELRSLRFG